MAVFGKADDESLKFQPQYKNLSCILSTLYVVAMLLSGAGIDGGVIVG